MLKKKVTLFLTGGLGNQLFQYAAALSRNVDTITFDCVLGAPRKNKNGKPDIFDFELPTVTKIHVPKIPKYIFSKTSSTFAVLCGPIAPLR
jgi:hypothetical protein